MKLLEGITRKRRPKQQELHTNTVHAFQAAGAMKWGILDLKAVDDRTGELQPTRETIAIAFWSLAIQVMSLNVVRRLRKSESG